MHIALQYTYHVDIIFVPFLLGKKIKKVQNLFDKWLFNKSNNHGNWIIKGGKKVAVAFDTATFIHYINEYHLNDNEEKAYIVESGLRSAPNSSVMTLFF